MTEEPDPAVVPLRRPPIRQQTVVRSDVAHTFEVFVRDIGAWWPARPFSIGQHKVVGVTFERSLGGRVYETWSGGDTVNWGEVIAWEPPFRFAMTWTILPATTEVELRFAAIGPALTRVDLEHRGWERLSEADLAAATSIPGGYSAGWHHILERFRATVEGA
jgi:hypothetical protein